MHEPSDLDRLRERARAAGITPEQWSGYDFLEPPMRERLTGALVDVMLDADFYAAAISDRVAFWRGEWGITYAPFVTVDDEVMGGMPVFRGTRVAVGVVLDNLQDGMTLDAILGEYETLNRADIEAVLEIRHKLPVP